MNRQRIRELIEILKSSGAGEMEVREGDLRVRLRKRTDGAVAAQANYGEVEADACCAGHETGAELAADDHVTVSAHLVGLFHRGRRPGEQPLVQAGDDVTAGQVIGTIEALRNFTDVTSPTDGIVVQVIAEDGQAVQYGAPLLAIGPSA